MVLSDVESIRRWNSFVANPWNI